MREADGQKKIDAGGRKRSLPCLLRRSLGDRRGTTLVELVVTFALMAIFASGITRIITQSFQTYYRIKKMDYALQVSETLMNKITGELEGARISSAIFKTAGETMDDDPIQIKSGGDSITLYDRTGSRITIQKNADYLEILYASVRGFEEVSWTYDKAMYMGFTIKDLKFEKAGTGYPGNVIKVTLTLEGNGYSSYQSVDYVECYNFAKQEDWDKIK